jgi:hypothetical protein
MKLRVVSACMVACLSLPSVVLAEDAGNSLVGAWKLISVETRRTDGTVSPLYGVATSGVLVYDRSGQMSAHLMDLSIQRCGTMDRRKCPDAVARNAFDNYLGYWGRYELLPGQNVVVHHVEGASHPDWIGTDQKRYFELSGNRVMISTPPMMIRGVESVVVVVAERIEAQ